MTCKEEIQNYSPFWGTELDLSLILKPDSCKTLSLSWRNSRLVENQPWFWAGSLNTPSKVLQTGDSPTFWAHRQFSDCLLSSCHLLGPSSEISSAHGFTGAHHQGHLPPPQLLENTNIGTSSALKSHMRSWQLNNSSESFPLDFHHPLVKPVSIPLLLFSAPRIKVKRDFPALLCPPLLEL